MWGREGLGEQGCRAQDSSPQLPFRLQLRGPPASDKDRRCSSATKAPF